jgi:hypothetical protein
MEKIRFEINIPDPQHCQRQVKKLLVFDVMDAVRGCGGRILEDTDSRLIPSCKNSLDKGSGLASTFEFTIFAVRKP